MTFGEEIASEVAKQTIKWGLIILGIGVVIGGVIFWLVT